ncbi:MAG: YkvA family protein [Blastocatellia bacterium]
MAKQLEQTASEQLAPRQVTRIERKEARGFLHNAIYLIPNFLKLLYRLFKDSRVPTAEKAFLIGAIVYVISPIDLIPDVIPFIGEVDDLYLVALTILRLLNRTPADVVREHWDGGGDIARIVGRMAQAASFILPKRVANILLGKVVIAPKIKGVVFTSPADQELEDIHRSAKKA